MRLRHVLAVVLVVVAGGRWGAGTATAGTYVVPACHEAGGAAGGWTAFNTNPTSLETGANCGASGAQVFDGLFGRDKVDPPGPAVTPGNKVGVGFSAPAGTTITGVSYNRFFRIQGERNWAVGLRVSDGPNAGLYDNCLVTGAPGAEFSCSSGTSGGGASRVLTGLRASRLELGGFCEPRNPSGSNACGTGGIISSGPYYTVVGVLYGASVTLEDALAPLVGGLSGPLGWVRGSVPVGVSGSDGQSGLRRIEVLDASSTVRGTLGLDCVASQPVPCPTGAQSGSVALDTSGLADGTAALRARAVDAGGETAVSSSALTLRVDNTPPAPPAVSAAASGGAWSTRASDTLSVAIGAETDRSPITTLELERCAPSGSCVISSMPAAAGGTQQAVAIDGLVEGVTRLKVRLVDQAGNVGAWSPGLDERIDRTAPGVVTVGGVPDGWTNQAPAISAVGAEDGLSGTDHVELELCDLGGVCVTRTAGPPPASVASGVGEGEYDVRARQVDRAGNTSAWSASRRLRIDTTAPTAAVGPVPASVLAGTVLEPVTSGQDARSGVATVSLEVEENGVWRVAGGPVTARAGVVYRFRARAVDMAGNAAVSNLSETVMVTAPPSGSGPGPGPMGPTGTTGLSRPMGGSAARVVALRVRAARRASGAVRVTVSGMTRAVVSSRRVRVRVTVGATTRVVLVRVRSARFATVVTVADRRRRARRVSVSSSVPGSRARAMLRRARLASR